jgi:hypothetical protein
MQQFESFVLFREFDEKGELRSVETEIENAGDMQAFMRKQLGASTIWLISCTVKLSWCCVLNRTMRISNPFMTYCRQV